MLTSTLRRSVQTTARSGTAFATRANPVRQPLHSSRNFQTSTARMTVHNILNKDDFDVTVKKNSVVVVDFFATWCGPCKAIAPELVKFSETYSNAHFVKVDVDEVSDVAQEYKIRAMPTFLVLKDGEKVEEVVGANPPALEAAIAKHAS